jgi:hypothetical protein
MDRPDANRGAAAAPTAHTFPAGLELWTYAASSAMHAHARARALAHLAEVSRIHPALDEALALSAINFPSGALGAVCRQCERGPGPAAARSDGTRDSPPRADLLVVDRLRAPVTVA